MPNIPIYFDTVVLSNFVFGGLLESMIDYYTPNAFSTTQVMDEIESGISAGYHDLQLVVNTVKNKGISIVSLNPLEYGVFETLLQRLGRGEASLITCGAAGRKGIVSTDDRAAREMCRDRNVKYIGTIGILQILIKEKTISLVTADNALSKMISAGFYSPIKRLGDIL